MQTKKIKLGQVKKIFTRLPRLLGERLFLTAIGLILLAVIIGASVFYDSVILIDKEEPSIEMPASQLGEETYQNVLAEWQKRQQEFENINLKTYSDPFNPSFSGSATTTTSD